MGRWLEQYRAGQHRQVWTELTSARRDADAAAVARETMQRARRNVERLVERLPGHGYRFEGTPHTPPPADTADQLDALEHEIGAIPLALRVWFEEVGQVNLNGTHPEWTFDYPDPLVVEAPIDYIRSEFEEWTDERYSEVFEIPLAPDFLHKANVSGGAPYSLAIPNAGADGLLLSEPHQTTFVNYLRIAFAAAGMPGWFHNLHAEWARPPRPPAWLAQLAAELEPI